MRIAVPAALLSVLVLGACTRTIDGDASPGPDVGPKPSDVLTDYGVTDDTITLLSLLDADGSTIAMAQGVNAGVHVWASDVNADGGICERQIEIVEFDNDHQDQLTPLAIDEHGESILGAVAVMTDSRSSIGAALGAYGMLGATWIGTSDDLQQPTWLSVGPTADIEAINALSHLVDAGLLADGGTVGMVRAEYGTGPNTKLGVDYFAGQHGITVVDVPVQQFDSTTYFHVPTLVATNVDAVLVALPPVGLAMFAKQAAEGGLAVPMIGTSSTFLPVVMDDPTVAAALSEFGFLGRNQPASADSPLVTHIVDESKAINSFAPAKRTSWATPGVWRTAPSCSRHARTVT